MADNNNSNATTLGVDNTSALSNTTPKLITNNNTTPTGVDNTTMVAAPATADNNTNDNNSFTPHSINNYAVNNNSANNNNKSKNYNPTPHGVMDIDVASASTAVSTVQTKKLNLGLAEYVAKCKEKTLLKQQNNSGGHSSSALRANAAAFTPASSSHQFGGTSSSTFGSTKKVLDNKFRQPEDNNNHASDETPKIDAEDARIDAEYARLFPEPVQQQKKRFVESTSTPTETLQSHLCNAFGQIEQSFGQVEEQHNTIKEKEETIGKLNETLQESLKLVDEKEATITRLGEELAGIRYRFNNALIHVSKLQDELKKSSAVEAEFKEQIAALNQVGESVQAQLNEEREKRTSAEAELKEERKKNAELEAKIKALPVDSMEKADESTVEGAAAAPEEDDNSDDKMTEVGVEEKTSAGEHSEPKPKEKLAVPDNEMKEANEPAVPDAEMKEVNGPADKSNDDDTAEPKRKRKGSRGRPRSISTPPTHHMKTRRSKSRSNSLSEMDSVKPAAVSTTNAEAEMSAVEKNVDGDTGKKKTKFEELAKEMGRLQQIGKGTFEENHDLVDLPAEEGNILARAQPLIGDIKRLNKESQEKRNALADVLIIKEDSSAGILYQRGIELQKMGSIEHALKCFDKALSLGPSHDLPSTLHSRVDDCMKSLLLAYVRGEGELPPLPASWEEWKYNQMFADLQRLLGAWSKVEAVAKKYDRNVVPFLYFGNDLTMVEYVIIIDFPRDGQGAHLGYPDGVPNGSPPNATIRRLLDTLTAALSQYFDIPSHLGRPYIMQKFAFFDILAIDGPYNQANKKGSMNYDEKINNTYKKIVEEADVHMAEFMNQALTIVPNAKLAGIVSNNTREFFKAHPDILPSHEITLPYKSNSPHPCILCYGFVVGANENQGYAHLESMGALFQSYFGLKCKINVTRGMLDIMFGNNINSIESYSLQLWDKEPEKVDSRLLLSKYTMEEVASQIPIKNDDKNRQIYNLKVDQHKKIKHNKLVDAHENEVQLYVRKVKDRVDFESDALPLDNPKTTGKKNKASSGGLEMIIVRLYLESALNKNASNDYIIDESAFAAQVGTQNHACRIMGTGTDKLSGIKPGMQLKITAVEEKRGRKVTYGNDFVAVGGKAGKNYQNLKGPEFESLPAIGKERFIPHDYWGNSMSNDDIKKIFDHHADNCNESCTDPNCKHWKKISELSKEMEEEDTGNGGEDDLGTRRRRRSTSSHNAREH